MIDSLIKKIFLTDSYSISDLDRGISNKNYLLSVQGKQFVLRIPKISKVFDRQQESHVLELIKPLDIDIETLYFDKASGIKISPYIENLWDFTEYHDSSRIKKAALILRKLHHAKLQSGKRFAPLSKLKEYQREIVTKAYPYEDFQDIVTEVENYQAEEILCHNDLVAGNICFTDLRTYLIDYEYAGDNDPLFDVMSFVTENKLSKAEEDEFISIYFDNELTTSTVKKLRMWRNFHNLLWLSWANMMFDHTQEEIFRAIAEDKYQALKNK